MAIRAHPPDNPQLDLLGGAEVGPAAVHRLFFALLPDEVTRAQLAHTADGLRARHPAFRARWVDPARYHATLHFLGDHALLRQDMVEAAMVAASKLRMVPFEWSLRDATSFHGRQPPCVLLGSSVPEPLQQLWQGLRDALILAGQGRHIERSFTPHVTVAYSHAAPLVATSIDPVAWRVEQLALIHSVMGQPNYEVLARWPPQGSVGMQR